MNLNPWSVVSLHSSRERKVSEGQDRERCRKDSSVIFSQDDKSKCCSAVQLADSCWIEASVILLQLCRVSFFMFPHLLAISQIATSVICIHFERSNSSSRGQFLAILEIPSSVTSSHAPRFKTRSFGLRFDMARRVMSLTFKHLVKSNSCKLANKEGTVCCRLFLRGKRRVEGSKWKLESEMFLQKERVSARNRGQYRASACTVLSRVRMKQLVKRYSIISHQAQYRKKKWKVVRRAGNLLWYHKTSCRVR